VGRLAVPDLMTVVLQVPFVLTYFQVMELDCAPTASHPLLLVLGTVHVPVYVLPAVLAREMDALTSTLAPATMALTSPDAAPPTVRSPRHLVESDTQRDPSVAVDLVLVDVAGPHL